MVLIFSVTNNDESRGVGKKNDRYQLTAFKGRLAVFYDIRHPPPDPETAATANDDVLSDEALQYPFFVSSFDGLIDNAKDESDRATSSERDTLELLMADISSRVAVRENVTIINRGASADEFVERIIRALQKSVEMTADNAMQIVADEIAKEKQMQRLLQLENAANVNVVKTLVKNVNELERPTGKIIGLSPELSRSLQQLRKKNISLLNTKKKATERFTLLTAAHYGELVPPCTKGSCLTPEAFTTMPPNKTSRQNPVSRRKKHSSSRSSYYAGRSRRKSTLAILEMLAEYGDGKAVEPLKGNGWGKEIEYYVFNGESSMIVLPGIPKFEDVVKCLTVDFWFRIDTCETVEKRVMVHIMDGPRADLGQLFQISYVNTEEMSEAICIYVRDSANRVLECLMPFNENTVPTKEAQCFHHFMLDIQSLEEGNLECLFDGRPTALQIVQQEYPIFFNAWPHRLFVGGYVDESKTPLSVFCGVIFELRFGLNTTDGRQPIVRWPLIAEDGELKEMIRTVPLEHHEMLSNLEKIKGPPPRSAPFFDGNLVANLGTVGVMGELLHNWRMEIRFCTHVNNRTMTLVGVTDRQCRMQELGIVLNAEPVFGSEHFRFHEFNITLYLVDAYGACCSALLRGSEHQNLMDGQWHTLVWKCVDSESNNFRVKVDGVGQELFYIVREGPRRFFSFVDWMCLGGHNVRNYKVKRPFHGIIGRFYISVCGVRIVTLHMDEGPGSYVMQDMSSCCNHGLLIDLTTNAVRRHNVYWFPQADENVSESTEISKKDGVIIYKNNAVSLAAVVFTCTFDAFGVAHEIVHDIFGEASVELDVVEAHSSDIRPQWKTWRAIPDSCFKKVDNLVQLEETVNSALSSKKPLGHFMFVIRIGDCYVTLLNLHGPILPPDATYDRSTLKWQYAYAVSGTSGKREILLNHMLHGVERILLTDTLTPFTTARLGPINVKEKKSIVTEDIIRSMQHSGKPWFLSAVLHNHLLNTEYGSSLHIIHHFARRLTADEAASIALFNRRLYNGTKEKASLIIQRNWRGRQARNIAMHLRGEKELREQKVEEIALLRQNPIVKAKTTLSALLITLHEIDCDAIPPIVDEIDELSEALTKQGYEVTHLHNASKSALMKAISELDESLSGFVYISGYGGRINVHQPLLFSLHSLHILISEGAERASFEHDYGVALRAINQEFRGSFPPPKMKKKKKSRASVFTLSKKALQEAEMLARQREELFRMSVAGIDNAEVSAREEIAEEYDTEVLMIIREISLAINATTEYERVYKKDSQGMQFILPCESRFIEPYADTVYSVEELLQTILQRQMPPFGLQRIVAMDLEPITPMSSGYACVASSTGYTLRFPYQPQQRRVISHFITKAFEGRLPSVAGHSKYAVLKGGIQTEPNERDWRSFATYLLSKMQSTCSREVYTAACEELDREIPFSAELIPVRNIFLDADLRDKQRRERDSKEVNVTLHYGVGSSYVQSDMFAVFKNVITFGGPLKEILFKNTIYILFTRSNKNIEGIVKEKLLKEIEQCRPADCDITISVDIISEGARVFFGAQKSEDKLHISHWISGIVVRSLTWQIPVIPVFGYRNLDVDHVEYVYEIKTRCSLRKLRQLKKQRWQQPVPKQYMRFLKYEVMNAS